jgi:acyl carrier protein phosphodiesterase
MNYLAHFYLSDNNEDYIIGNLLGDFVKGNKLKDYSEGIARGIQMHRSIDEYTDAHPYSKFCRDILRPQLHKYSGIALDILYDYCLAINWRIYSNQDLNVFSNYIYHTINNHSHLYTTELKRMILYMQNENWLLMYQHQEGIEKTFYGMSRRIKSENNLTASFSIYKTHEQEFNQAFEYFFADIRKEIQSKFF